MKNISILVLILDLLVLNLLVGYLVYTYVFLANTNKPFDPELLTGKVETTEPTNLDELRAQFGDLTNRVGNLELTPYPTAMVLPTSTVVKTTKVVIPTIPVTKNISYVEIPGSGETNNLGWVDISGTDFYFDKAEYPGLLTVTMEGSIRLFNGSGTGYVRLFDVTHGIAVVGSEVFTQSQMDTLVSSGNLNMWSGKNRYRVQAKSNASDRLIFSWGKLKITVQQ